MSTQLQEVYDAFFNKSEEDYTYKTEQVYQFLKTAKGYSYKTTPHNLDYTLYSDNSVLIINNTVSTDGFIQININNDTFDIELFFYDRKVDIANKIQTALSEEGYSVNIQYGDETNDSTIPILTITKTSVTTITTTFVDTDKTGLDLEVKITYDGEFTDTLDVDEIELISLFMKREEIRKLKAPLDSLKSHIGTKDFNRLDDKVKQLDIATKNLKATDEEIFKFRQEFYSYSN